MDEKKKKLVRRPSLPVQPPEPKLAGKLFAFDFDPNQRVVIDFDDDSRAEFRSAFAQVEGEWWAVYTEHCGYLMFPKASVSALAHLLPLAASRRPRRA